MWVAVHAFTGLALGAVSPVHPALTLIAALALHGALDLVPHWDYTGDRRRILWASGDVAVAAIGVVAAAAVLELPAIAVVAAVVSALPDLDVFDAVLPGGPRRRLFPSHWAKFPHGQASAPVGIAIQVCVAVASLLLAAFVSI